MIARLLLCTDLDRTLIPNGSEPESPGAREAFQRLAARRDVHLAYVSGRSATLVRAAIVEYALPQPDHVIADVGTTLYEVNRGECWREDASWTREIARDWGGRSCDDLHTLLLDLPWLLLQEPMHQRPYKLSYYLPLSAEAAEVRACVRERLEPSGVHVAAIHSIDPLKGAGLLDVVPERATKLHAIEFLRDALGLAREATLFCGDSGNDLAVLASAIPGVLVANASAEVRKRALELSAANRTEASLYLANGGFMDMNGNYAAGILEGVAHYHPALAESLVAPPEEPRDGA